MVRSLASIPNGTDLCLKVFYQYILDPCSTAVQVIHPSTGADLAFAEGGGLTNRLGPGVRWGMGGC